MMLWKRMRSHQREQLANNWMPCATPSSCFISNPNYFRIFSGFGNPFRRHKASPTEVFPKSWDCHKVGLSIIDSLDKEAGQSGYAAGLFCKNIHFGRRISIRNLNASSHANPLEVKSLPEDIPVLPWAKPANVLKNNSPNVVFEIGEAPPEQGSEIFHSYSLDPGRYGSSSIHQNTTKTSVCSEFGSLGGSLKSDDSSGQKFSSSPSSIRSSSCFTGSISSNETELSEHYTCVKIHGSNPRVVHIFLNACNAPTEAGRSNNVFTSYCSNDFLKVCYSCKKELDGKDIYMYRGEKAFCSCNCRSQEIEIDQDTETTNNEDNTSEIPSCG